MFEFYCILGLCTYSLFFVQACTKRWNWSRLPCIVAAVFHQLHTHLGGIYFGNDYFNEITV